MSRDPYLALSDEIEGTIDSAQEHHLNGNLVVAEQRLRAAIDLIKRLQALEGDQ
jgi:hypothetical protein